MAYLNQVDTSTLSGQNLNTALLVHTFTNTTRLRKLWVDVFLTGIAGNGDYTAYLTRQKAGAGVFYESLKTTKPVGVGITSIMFNTMALTINATDVVKVYVLGLAGDNTAAVGVITEVNEEWVNIDASGRVDLGAWLGATPNALSSGDVSADMVKISGDATAADNLESVLDGTGGAALKMGQVTIAANVNAQGALDIRNAHATGYGVYAGGGTAGQLNQASAGGGQENIGTAYGQYNLATAGTGQTNSGTVTGQGNAASAGTGQYNIGTTQGQWNTASAGTGQINGGTTYGQVNAASAGPGQYDSGSTYGIQAVGVTDPLSAGMITAGAIATDAIDADALKADAVTEIQAGLATSANQTTILNRLGAFTGTGVNTVLGFLRAMANKAAGIATPTDLSASGTFDNTTDSEEAISDQVSTLAPGAPIVLNADITEIHT